MSDQESRRSSVSIKTEGLYDHRHQADSLPIRRGSVFDTRLPPAAMAAGNVQDEDPLSRSSISGSGPGPVPTPMSRLPRVKLQDGSDSDGDDDYAIADSTDNFHLKSQTPRLQKVSTIQTPTQQSGSTQKRTRSKSFTEQFKGFVSKDSDGAPSPGGILLNKSSGRGSKGAADVSPVIHPLSKTMSRQSKSMDIDNEVNDFDRRRRMTRGSLNDSDADSQRSRESQETEEDVCFPLVPDHVKVNGIDFDEIDDFISESRLEDETLRKENFNNTSSSESSAAANKYIPKTTTEQESTNSSDSGIQFGSNKVEGEELAPDRFSFFCSESDETIHAPDIQSLTPQGQSIRELFRNGQQTWWLDCICPTDSEMKVLSKAFGIHPLTAEDIRMQETREKVELFRSYYFVCFHTFDDDKESEEFLEPINVYIVVFRYGVLTFHFAPIPHAANVRRRVRQLRDYVDVSADWLCYALIDDITDSFAPVIHAIEYEADAIEDQVFITREVDVSHMLRKIGESRRKVMTLMRLLSGKADVIKMFAKRCQDEIQGIGLPLTSTVNLANLASQAQGQQAQPRADIALYLGDIQDHVVTMYQNLLSYEKIFSRSHSNYLAQLQVESFYSNHKVTEMLSKVTVIGTLLVPMNLVTGLFGMNVKVPWQDGSTLDAFFGIIGFIACLVILFSVLANWWLTRKTRQAEAEGVFKGSGARSILSFGKKKVRGVGVERSRETRSMLSRLDRYE